MAHSVIVGMGAAGFAAAETIRRHQPDAVITAVTDDPHGYYSRPGLAYALTGEVPEKQLFPIDRKRWSELKVEQVHRRVMRLQPSNKEVILADGAHLAYDSLLLATGAQAVEPDLPGIDQEGVVVLDSSGWPAAPERPWSSAAGSRRSRS
jgi:NADPH-dependent 2,4-dienoyl-CoA reductase/sulfur reductase-like enzyme